MCVLNYLMGDGLSPLIFHGTNVLIHGLVSLLSLYLCRVALKMRLASSLIASAMFALHPIHTEAIAGITGRSDALACLLMLISFLLYHKSLTASHQQCYEECHNQYDDGNAKRKEQSGGKDRSSKDDADGCVKRACRVSGNNVKGGDQEFSCDYDTGNSNSSSQGRKQERKKSSLRHYHHDHQRGEKDGGGMNSLTHNCGSGDESNSSCSGGDDEHHVVGCSSDTSGGSCDSGVVCDDGGCSQATMKKMRYFFVFCPWFIASGLVGCSAMLAKETGVTILGINLVYDLYTHLHLLRLKR
ncbi:Transmembrane and TPR repeat-containing protein 3 [Orchesella cincta]|uniref:Transmembrane and TPR repeat-containing protein 3 n=1 Tax=Orchesella cincta TaxID=48709 RepID=A0A1D2N2X5_ORCCI|nr:Transmembrane and TPR repeat-containing protein 3 [Orchesella cincta]